jgi:hypothetical protein
LSGPRRDRAAARIVLPGFPERIFRQRVPLLLRERHGGNGGEAHPEIWLVECCEPNPVADKPLHNVTQGGLVGHTDGNDRRDFLRIVGEFKRHLIRGVIGLNYLLCEGDVLTDEDVEVGMLIDLVTVRDVAFGDLTHVLVPLPEYYYGSSKIG